MIPSDRTVAAAPAIPDPKQPRIQKLSRADKPPGRRRNAQPAGRAKTTAQRAKKTATPQRGSKTAKILALLKRPGGASLQQLQKATGWQAHSVRGFLSGTLKRRWACASIRPSCRTAGAPTASPPSSSPNAATRYTGRAALLSYKPPRVITTHFVLAKRIDPFHHSDCRHKHVLS